MIIHATAPLSTMAESGGELPTLFLAGSIEMGLAEPWQDAVAPQLEPHFTLYNPRRTDWDSNWGQSRDDPRFYEQVSWELTALERADAVLVYFQPGTQSPVSLLELGLHARSKKVSVCCPHGFWCKGNIEIVCERWQIPFFDSLDNAVAHLISTQPRYLANVADRYLNGAAVYTRLEREYSKYGSIIVAFDFDGTVHDCHREGLTFNAVQDLLMRCRRAGFTLVCFTCSVDEGYVRRYLDDAGIPVDYINETPPFVSIPMNPKKVYYNILLDDRAGLSEACAHLDRILSLHEHKHSS